jgi:2-dehydro-3-deoxyphosphogluconate aldolase / (4S)-4-hydroxy-2-oxoglutarate aldolase
MPRYTRLDVLNELLRIGLIPLFFEPDSAIAFQAVRACQQGGARLIEFTNRGDFAWQVFGEIERRLVKEAPGVILGAGTIDDAPTAAMFIASGANFVVGPTFNQEIARLCNRHKVAYMPGCATVSEIATAEEWGAEICKVFPGETIGGPNFIKSVLAPRPWSRLMPTGGVSPNEENISTWIKAGACALGMGSNLINKNRLQAGDFESITRDVAQVLGWIQKSRAA